MQGVVVWLLAVAGAVLRHRMLSCKRVGALIRLDAALHACGGYTCPAVWQAE